jgi:hypothetical protein
MDAGKTCFACRTRGGGPVKVDHRIKASFGKIQHGFALAGKAGLNAPSAKDTPVGIIVDKRMVPDDGGLFEGFFKSARFQANPQELRDPLKLASPVALTVAAIHIVDGHEEAKSALLKVPHGWRVSPHDHPFSDFNGACGHWFF